MLGGSSTQSLIRTGDSVGINSKAILEWNHNTYNRPRVCGSVKSSSNATTLSANILTLTALNAWSQTTSLKDSTSNNFGASPVKTLSSTSSGITTTSTFSSLFTFPLTSSNACKISFYIKSQDTSSDKVMLKIKELDGSSKTVASVTRLMDMNSVQWQLRKLSYSPINASTATIRVEIASEQTLTTNSTIIYLSDIMVCEVTKYELQVEGVHSVEGTFEPFRPGEEIAEQGLDKELSAVIYRTARAQEYAGTPTAVPSYTPKISSPSASDPIYMPSLNSLNYFVTPKTTNGAPVGVFGYYDKTLTTNKIVIKMLNSGPNTKTNRLYMNNIMSYTLWTYKIGTGWTQYANVGTMNKNGSLIVYWNGSTWSSTINYSTINEADYSLSNTTTIDGIAFTVDKIGQESAIFGDATTGVIAGVFDTSVRFLEVSPRLAIDMSTYIDTYSISKETDNGSLPLAVGLANANSCSLVLENIPRVYNSQTVSLFSDRTGVSPLVKLGLIDRNVKVRIKYDLKDSSGSTVQSDIPLFVGYVESWDINEEDATLNLFDYSKILQKKNTNDILLYSEKDSPIEISVSNCLKILFEQNGFSDYNTFQTNPTLFDNVLSAYYTDNQKNMWENIQELLLPYSYIGYFDEYGMFNLTNFKTKSSLGTDFVFTDTDGIYDANAYVANVVSLSENASDRIGKVTINYNSLYKKHSTDPASDQNKFTTVERPTTQILWEAGAEEGLGYSTLKNGMNPDDTTITLNQDLWITEPEMAWTSYNGYAAIGSEIVKYSGLEIQCPLSATITYATTDGSTITYYAKNNFRGGQTVSIPLTNGLSVSTFNGSKTITSATSSTFTVTQSVTGKAVTNKALTSNVATLTSNGHGYAIGDLVTVNIADTTFNGIYKLSAVTTNTFSYVLIASNITSAATTGTVYLNAKSPQNVFATITSETQKYIVKSQSDLEKVLSGLRSINQINNTISWSYTGRLMNVERGMFGTKAQYHVAPASISDVTTAYPEFLINGGVSANAVSANCTFGLKDNIAYIYLNGTTAGSRTMAYLNGQDSNSYNNYFFSFYIPQTDATKNADDVVVLALGYDTSGNGYYIHLPSNSNPNDALLYYGSTLVAKSTFHLDTMTAAETHTVKGRKKTKTVVDKRAIYDKLQWAYVSIDKNKNMQLIVNDKIVTWYWMDGAAAKSGTATHTYIMNPAFTRTSKSIAIGVVGSATVNTVGIESVAAWQDGSFTVSPKFNATVDSVAILHNGNVNINKVAPVFFGVNPSVFGMQIYDVDLTSGPSYNQMILKTTGAHEFKDSADETVTKIVKVNPEQSQVSPIVGNPFKSRFMYINVGESFIPLSGSGSGTFNSTKVYGYAIQKTGDIQYVLRSDRMMSNDTEIQISSDWIQNKSNAADIANLIVNNSLVSGNTIDIEAFGNPLLTIGDVVKIKYFKTGNTSESKYIVVSAKTDFNNGINSTFTVRRIT